MYICICIYIYIIILYSNVVFSHCHFWFSRVFQNIPPKKNFITWAGSSKKKKREVAIGVPQAVADPSMAKIPIAMSRRWCFFGKTPRFFFLPRGKGRLRVDLSPLGMVFFHN